MPDKQRFQAVIDVRCIENHPNDSRLKETGDLAPTIPSRAGTGGGNVPLVMLSQNGGFRP